MTDLEFHTSSYSGNRQDCVEVAHQPQGAAVRDTKNREAGHLEFPPHEWQAFVHAARTDSL
ncbi:DUF397 domain-containing protein [Lipingzhangella sp. LS1_29]|uniref:DUF397 domain-containing protein n=1 Tax=Lipingzhangella rawalii TaxID=2055835 RepID=A0ABU2H3G3_9ACTN|nr:DUF397 domain-containing protein [Lipingzhangella rawalii]MDS1269843.1 DUF397 domain-containing protein [Lipingzhangella rawalii]